MSKRVLILGMIPFDSGKTVLASLLTKNLVAKGESVEYFKPISGHNYWFRYEHTQRCLAEKKLYSFDAFKVRQYLKQKVAIEVANPMHTLFAPAILNTPEEIVPSSLALAGKDSVFTMQRISRPQGQNIKSFMLIAKNLIDSGKLIISHSEAELLSYATEPVFIADYNEAAEYTENVLEDTLDANLHLMEDSADYILIEGFNDSAWLWDGLDHVDSVLVTGPGHAFIYEPERFRKAALLKKFNSQPIREVPFSRVSDLIKPIDRVLLTPSLDLENSQVKKMIL
jgi:predicted P-loop ATPase/GTPase